MTRTSSRAATKSDSGISSLTSCYNVLARHGLVICFIFLFTSTLNVSWLGWASVRLLRLRQRHRERTQCRQIPTRTFHPSIIFPKPTHTHTHTSTRIQVIHIDQVTTGNTVPDRYTHTSLHLSSRPIEGEKKSKVERFRYKIKETPKPKPASHQTRNKRSRGHHHRDHHHHHHLFVAVIEIAIKDETTNEQQRRSRRRLLLRCAYCCCIIMLEMPGDDQMLNVWIAKIDTRNGEMRFRSIGSDRSTTNAYSRSPNRHL